MSTGIDLSPARKCALKSTSSKHVVVLTSDYPSKPNVITSTVKELREGRYQSGPSLSLAKVTKTKQKSLVDNIPVTIQPKCNVVPTCFRPRDSMFSISWWNIFSRVCFLKSRELHFLPIFKMGKLFFILEQIFIWLDLCQSDLSVFEFFAWLGMYLFLD